MLSKNVQEHGPIVDFHLPFAVRMQVNTPTVQQACRHSSIRTVAFGTISLKEVWVKEFMVGDKSSAFRLQSYAGSDGKTWIVLEA
ncbi:hypothetical protein TNCV_2073771 [Trichonephila clavipes]|nr:hypothetical protein TNCV_2073771 [Trichonephila clavipes]